MRIGETQTLAATVTPAEAADKAVTWSSDAPAVAFVNPVTGEVTALSVGPAVITATTRDGNKQAFCAVTVSAAGSDPTTFTLTGTIFSGSAVAAWPNVSASFDGGDTYAVTASITNRQFSLTLPATNSLGGFFASTPSGVTISPSNAKFGWVWLYARSGTQKSEMTLATLSGMISIIDYIYADMDVNITGSYTSSTYTYTLNMQMKKGWNIIVLTDNGNNTCNESIAASVPSGAVWISEDDLGSSSSQAQAAGGREASIKSGFAELFKNGINEGLKIKK
jgi:hypothetical protein